MAAKLQQKPVLRERYKEAMAKAPDASVTEKKPTVVSVDDSEKSGPDPSPLMTAFKKAKGMPVKAGLDPDERLEGEEDSPDFDRESLGKSKPKPKEVKPDEKEEKEVEEEPPVVLDDKKEKKKATESLTDEEIEGIDESTLTDKHGRPPSREAWQTVKLLKEKLKTQRAELEAQIAELSKKTVDVETAEPYVKLKADKDALQKKIDEKYFEESPDFINTFVAPFAEKEKEVAEWLSTAEIDPESSDHVDAVRATNDLQKAMDAGDRKAYFIAAAKLKAFLPDGIDQQFLISVTEMYPLYQAKKAAFTDKDKARKTVTSNELNQVDGATKVIERTMEDVFSSYEVENADLLKFYRSDAVKEQIPYDDIVTQGKKEVRELMREFVATRKPTEKLVRILADAVLKPFQDKEIIALRAALKARGNQVENLEKELGKKKETLKKFGVSSKPGKETSNEDEKPSSTPLSDRFKKMQQSA